MKKKLLLLVTLFSTGIIYAQIGINTKTPTGLIHIKAKNTTDTSSDVLVNTDGNVSVGFTGNQSKLAVDGDVALGENIPGKMGYGSKIYFEGVKHVNDIWMAKYNATTDITELRVNIGIENKGANRFEVGLWSWETLNYVTSWYVSTAGISSIGYTDPDLLTNSSSERLLVNGNVWVSDGIVLENNVTEQRSQAPIYSLEDYCQMITEKSTDEDKQDYASSDIEMNTLTNNLGLKIDDMTRYTVETYKLLQKSIARQQKLKDDIYLMKNRSK